MSSLEYFLYGYHSDGAFSHSVKTTKDMLHLLYATVFYSIKTWDKTCAAL